ncbi:MAG: ComF family protein [Anaerolineae bacterium]|nr:ComF family protein [Anaerolineae bacterium]
MTQQAETRTSIGFFSYTAIKNVGHTLLDLLFPASCVHCGRVDTGFCDICHADLANFPTSLYITTTETEIPVAATGVHQGILQSAVQALKYHGQPTLGIPLGQRLAQTIQQLDWTFDIIIPVPLHTSRYQERGYNQSQEMAVEVAKLMNCPCLPDAIIRTRSTDSQVGLNREERLRNLNDAFSAQTELINGKMLLLVDDVQTTGTTLSMCAEAAIQAGATAVYGITVTAAT